ASVAQVDEGPLICVDDAGPGISDEQKKEVFEPFTRGNNAADTPGTGIGLALVAQFAALHGGKAWAQDNAEGGASSTVPLPLRAPSKPSTPAAHLSITGTRLASPPPFLIAAPMS